MQRLTTQERARLDSVVHDAHDALAYDVLAGVSLDDGDEAGARRHVAASRRSMRRALPGVLASVGAWLRLRWGRC